MQLSPSGADGCMLAMHVRDGLVSKDTRAQNFVDD
jgi:hypothetical protein